MVQTIQTDVSGYSEESAQLRGHDLMCWAGCNMDRLKILADDLNSDVPSPLTNQELFFDFVNSRAAPAQQLMCDVSSSLLLRDTPYSQTLPIALCSSSRRARGAWCAPGTHGPLVHPKSHTPKVYTATHFCHHHIDHVDHADYGEGREGP